MKLGLSAWRQGYHIASWRMPGSAPGALLDFNALAALAKTAERGLFDMVFLADVAAVENAENPLQAKEREHLVAKFDPMTLLPALAMVTRHIGLVATVSTSYHHPYSTARAFASVDALSGGRSGWNLVTSYSADERLNYGVTTAPDAATRYERAYEYVKIVEGLWDSWDADAFICDQETGIYYDKSKLHVLAHVGKAFSVRGPLDVARSPQGRPVIVTAGDSDAAQELAAAHAEVIYAAGVELAQARQYYRSVKARLPRYNREPDSLKILTAVMPITAPTRAEARHQFELLQSLIHPEVGLGLLQNLFGDLRGADVDGPLPEVSTQKIAWAQRDFAGEMLRRARTENLTIRQLYEIVGSGTNWHLAPIGTPADVADVMQEWFETGASDGFNVLPSYTPGTLDAFVDLVVPELQRRGLFRTAYEGTTLRANLGLPEPPPRASR